MTRTLPATWLAAAAATAVAAAAPLAGCSSDDPAVAGDEAIDTSVSSPALRRGRTLFETAFAGSNGRSCASCHVLGEHTTLSPANVAARLAANPADPLFARQDADDPGAASPTYQHLLKGLVRVTVPLADNVDVIDEAGKVVTPEDRTISVWRGVPGLENVAMTAPYQRDGRAAQLPEQAQREVTAASRGPVVPADDLEALAAFERGLYSSARAREVALQVERSVPLAMIAVPEREMALDEQEQRGRAVYAAACEACHGGPKTTQVTDRMLHDLLFSELKPDGNVRFRVLPGVGPVPVQAPQPDNEFLNAGSGLIPYLGQLGMYPAFNASVDLPRYRFRFYEDGSRQRGIADLPPIPVTMSGDRLDPRPALDADGAPIVGPAFFPQWFTTDPGRAAVTGNPHDFEAFDVPQLRGIARTAPYYHDNSIATLKGVVDYYSQFILPNFPSLKLPAVHPPEGPGAFRGGESLSPAQKADLLAYLGRL
jgi:cytochrome c peroxidase